MDYKRKRNQKNGYKTNTLDLPDILHQLGYTKMKIEIDFLIKKFIITLGESL